MTRFLAPLISAYTDDTLSLSEVRLGRVIQTLIRLGAEGFVLSSESCELYAMGYAERKDFAELCLRATRGMPVYVDVSAATTPAMLDLCQHAARHGARGAIVQPPTHVPLTGQEIHRMIAALRRFGNVPITVVDSQGRARQLSSEQDTPADCWAKSLEESGHQEMAIRNGVFVDELALPEGVCSPLSWFGSKKAGQWPLVSPEKRQMLQRILLGFGTARVGKSIFANAGIETGPPRPPVSKMPEDASAWLKSLDASLRPAA